MLTTPPPTLVRRVTPGAWTALAWCVSTIYSFVVQIRWPGEQLQPWGEKSHRIEPFSMDHRELATLLLAVALLAGACRLLTRRPLTSMTMLVVSALVLTNGPLHTTSIAPEQYLPVCVALCFATAAEARRTSLCAAGLALTGLLGYIGTRLALGLRVGTSVEAVVLMMIVVAWVIGNARRQEREHTEQMRTRVAEQAVTAERLRIARELHDMVAHSIGVVAFQAGAARRVIDTQPEGARRALGAIEDTSRETLAGLRRMLGALHDAASGDAGKPAAGLDDVDKLVENVRDAGVRVDVEWRGERRPLPPEVDLSAFRIIQESVTNVVKHSRTQQCRVSVVFHPSELSVVIVDSGSGSGRGEGSGYGIAGMRDRVKLLHGDFTAGPRPEGGYRVTARLPIPMEV
ncbi:signal transduction histidine kinase [Streptomyces sp. Ag109_G2-6]|uniref:sensor histidine kinase n=1 Tax=Streptomyces TaxID=1883 RepID=UPI0009A55148|nr:MULTISPECIES: histidine kinase [Streptomyces]RPF45026.1 signal transduction histidine kinase [Streptomyces sp. Ag109_G2-6]